MNEQHQSFEQLRQLTTDGFEYWSARDLAPLLEYRDWRNFHKVIGKAMQACTTSNQLSRFRRCIPPKTKGDYAFILHMIETLKPDTGRIGVVVPPLHSSPWQGGGREGVFFRLRKNVC
ncbi:N-6 DNA methylase [Candidatus Thiothrix phosphatis]|uniref:N-6 DNA methylase n=1 Tax=Candidatus Thiothrix phosphatis TaxID=3112415 RepID=UPI002D782718|nr:N-6 DNA methylase [Candidatus Thiothrix sp. Deng01]